jgi:alpha-galactosidase
MRIVAASLLVAVVGCQSSPEVSMQDKPTEKSAPAGEVAVTTEVEPVTPEPHGTQSKPDPKLATRPKKLRIYILAGQSNMEGHARFSTFDYIGLDPKTAPMLKEMRGADGKPRTCEHVWITNITGRDNSVHTGLLTGGYGGRGSGKELCDKVGPEFTFGIYMEKAYAGPILLIKTAWGGKSLNTDFRPPSAGPYVLHPKTKALWDKHPNGAHGIPKAADRPAWQAKKDEQTGHYYRLMLGHVKKVLADPGGFCPAYDPHEGYEVSGFVWFQGWNDMCDRQTYPDGNDGPEGFAAYTDVMAQFIKDVRRDFDAPDMRFVIGTIGVNGDKAEGAIANLRVAMAKTAELPEFKGNVVAVDTGQFWDHEMSAIDPKLGDLNRLRDSAHILTDDGVMAKSPPGWEPVGCSAPEDRVWHYTTFDPQNEKDVMKNKREAKRFRDVTLPAGLEGWQQPGFDDSSWRTDKAPIGKGVWKYPRNTRPVVPKSVSDWGDGEFLLMRSTFEVDDLEYEKFRLSILSRQGFHVYLNGHKIHTYIWWKDAPYYRSIMLEPKHVAHLKMGMNVLAAYHLVHYDKKGQPYNTVDLAIEGLPADAVQYVNSREYFEKRMDTMFTKREQQLLLGASNGGYHYMGSGKILGQIGKAFAEAMQSLEQYSCERAKKPCLSQLWPICSNRPSASRYMFCPITGCSLVPLNQFNQHVPTLQETVPTEKAVMPFRVPCRVSWCRSPTMTSGLSPGTSHSLGSGFPAATGSAAATRSRAPDRTRVGMAISGRVGDFMLIGTLPCERIMDKIYPNIPKSRERLGILCQVVFFE